MQPRQPGYGAVWGLVCGGIAGIIAALALALGLVVVGAIGGDADGGLFAGAIVASVGSVVGGIVGSAVGLVLGLVLGAGRWHHGAKWVAALAAAALPIATAPTLQDPAAADRMLFAIAISGIFAAIGYRTGLTFERLLTLTG